MKTLKFKWIALILCIALLIGVLPSSVIASTTEAPSDLDSLFTVTNTLDDSNWDNRIYYCNYAETGYVYRPVSKHNPDGRSFYFGNTPSAATAYPVMQASGKFNSNPALDGAKATVIVVSADTNNTTTYPMRYVWDGVRENGSETTVISINNSTGHSTTTTWGLEDIGPMFLPNTTNYVITRLAEGTDLTDINSNFSFRSSYDAKNYPSKYYLDSIGATHDPDALINTLLGGMLFTLTRGFENTNQIHYSNYLATGVVERPYSKHNTDGKSYRFACGPTAPDYPMVRAYGNYFGNESAADAKATVLVVSADATNTDANPLRFTWEGVRVDGSLTTVVSINNTTGQIIKTTWATGTQAQAFQPNTTNYIITRLAEGTNLSTVNSYFQLSNSNNAKNYTSTFYLDAAGMTNDPAGLIEALESDTQTIDEQQLQWKTVDQLQADVVIRAIEDIGSVTPDSQESIANARRLYGYLGAAPRELVTNINLLEQAENTLLTWQPITTGSTVNISNADYSPGTLAFEAQAPAQQPEGYTVKGFGAVLIRDALLSESDTLTLETPNKVHVYTNAEGGVLASNYYIILRDGAVKNPAIDVGEGYARTRYAIRPYVIYEKDGTETILYSKTRYVNSSNANRRALATSLINSGLEGIHYSEEHVQPGQDVSTSAGGVTIDKVWAFLKANADILIH